MPRSIILSVVLLAGPTANIAAAGINWSRPIEVAAGRGERGEWRQNDSRYEYVDDGTPTFLGHGNIAVAWVDQGRKDVLLQVFARDGVKRFAEPVNVSRTSEIFSWLPRLVVSPRDPNEIFVLWQEIVFSGGSHGGEIFFARSRNGGASFDSPINLSNSRAGDGKGRINREHWQNGSFDLVVAPDGRLHVAWTDYEGTLWFCGSADGGGSFTKPRRVAGPEPHPARAPSLATAAGGVVYLAWTVGEDAAADIRVARSADHGERFSDPVVVHTTRSYSDAPRLAVDRGGTVHLVHGESERGPFTGSRIHYTQSTDGARTFAAPRAVSEPPPASAGYPGIVVDGDGAVTVCWERFARAREHPRGIGFARSADTGRTFTKPAIVPGSIDPAGGLNGSHQGLLIKKLAVSGDGALALVNSSLKHGGHSRVWLVRGQPAD